MTTPVGYNPASSGCTFPGCGTQATEFLSGLEGRRCSVHRPTFTRAQVEALLNVGAYEAARAYCHHRPDEGAAA